MVHLIPYEIAKERINYSKKNEIDKKWNRNIYFLVHQIK